MVQFESGTSVPPVNHAQDARATINLNRNLAVTSRRDEMFMDTKVHHDPKSQFIGESIVSILKELRFRRESAFSINIAPPRGWKEIKMKIGRTSFLAVALFMAASANLQTE